MQDFDPQDDNLGVARAIGEIVDRTTLIVHDEIELGKAEILAAVQDLVRGSVAGILGGIFGVFGLVIFLQAGALFLNDLFNWNAYPWLGYLTVAMILFIFGGIAAWIAADACRIVAGPASRDHETELIRGAEERRNNDR